jgi:iron(III) transport system permease protein
MPLSRRWLGLAILTIATLALLPVLALLLLAIQGQVAGTLALRASGQTELLNTVALVAGVAGVGGLLGTINGWLTARCCFRGRRWLRIAQLLPLATPSYLLAATMVDLASRWGWRLQGGGWAVLVLALGTYPYVFLLTTEQFGSAGSSQQDVCRMLGVGPWGSFSRVALPMALPAIGAGIALSGMEVVNDLGAVQLLGVPTLTAGILERWQGEGDLPGAVALALVAMVIVLLLVALERGLRRRSRRWSLESNRSTAEAWILKGWRQLGAQLLTLLPPLAALGLPVWWMASSLDQLPAEPLAADGGQELLALAARSFTLALAAAALAVAAGLLLAISRRWLSARTLAALSHTASLGYAIPGTVLALGLMAVGGGLAVPAALLLIWGYTDRFLAVSKGALDAALERLPPSVDEAAICLGSPWPEVLVRVHLPLLKRPLLVGCLLVFVDTVKELPLTFALRPFDSDTLAVRVYQYASDERLGAALLPSALILLLGLVAALALIPSLEGRIQSGRSKAPPG